MLKEESKVCSRDGMIWKINNGTNFYMPTGRMRAFIQAPLHKDGVYSSEENITVQLYKQFSVEEV